MHSEDRDAKYPFKIYVGDYSVGPPIHQYELEGSMTKEEALLKAWEWFDKNADQLTRPEEQRITLLARVVDTPSYRWYAIIKILRTENGQINRDK